MWVAITIAVFFLFLAVVCCVNRKEMNTSDKSVGVYSADACIFGSIVIVIVIIVKLIMG